MAKCECGAHVTERYIAVFEPEGAEKAEKCPECHGSRTGDDDNYTGKTWV